MYHMCFHTCAERELQRGEGGDHTPDLGTEEPGTEMAIEAFSGSPSHQRGAFVDDLDTVRREVISLGKTVESLSGRSVLIHLAFGSESVQAC